MEFERIMQVKYAKQKKTNAIRIQFQSYGEYEGTNKSIYKTKTYFKYHFVELIVY